MMKYDSYTIIFTWLLLFLVCSQSQQNLINVPLLRSANLSTFPIFTTEGIRFKGIPLLRSLNETTREIRSIYYYDQLVAVLDIAEGKRLIHCELIEVYEPHEAHEVLKNLSTISKSHLISFEDMLKLMDKCDKLDEKIERTFNTFNVYLKQFNEGNPLLEGIIPGTKWCGTGDIAKNYHDLGFRTTIDRCCRMHDLCPIKIRAYKSRYNLINNSFFSKSHCSCDRTFYNCLKTINHVSARLIGNIYFNIAQPVCIEDVFTSSEKNFKKFIPARRKF